MSTVILTEKQAVISYQIVTSKCKTDGTEGEIVYGVKITRSGDFDDLAEIEDISANKQEVEQFIFKLTNKQVTPDQLMYLVEDYLDELSSK